MMMMMMIMMMMIMMMMMVMIMVMVIVMVMVIMMMTGRKLLGSVRVPDLQHEVYDHVMHASCTDWSSSQLRVTAEMDLQHEPLGGRRRPRAVHDQLGRYHEQLGRVARTSPSSYGSYSLVANALDPYAPRHRDRRDQTGLLALVGGTARAFAERVAYYAEGGARRWAQDGNCTTCTVATSTFVMT